MLICPSDCDQTCEMANRVTDALTIKLGRAKNEMEGAREVCKAFAGPMELRKTPSVRFEEDHC